MQQLTISSLVLGLVLGSAVQDSEIATPSISEAYYDLPYANVIVIDDIELPALESGQLTEIMVKPGAIVSKDQQLAKMDDTRSRRALDEATLRHQIANKQANESTEVDAALKRAKLAYAIYEKTEKLARSGSMSVHEKQTSKASAEIAHLEWTGAKNNRELAAIQAAAEMVTVQASQDSINRHALKSPIDGVIYEVNRDAGEWVTAGETIMKIARMDKLRINCRVDGNSFNPWDLDNCKVTATVTLAQNKKVDFTGKVVLADPKKRMGNQFTIAADVENRLHGNSNHWQLRPGDTVAVRIHLKEKVTQSADRSLTSGLTK